jgi:branched-subunit amino acid aminotransferase/4-amino-4-deoxychorismate lyase
MAEIDGSPVTLEDLEALALTNYGHFTSMRVDDGAVRGLSLHLERLARDCQVVFGVGLDQEHLRGCIRRALDRGEGAFNIRLTVFDPALGLGNIGDPAQPRVLVTTRPAGVMPPPPLTAKTYPFTRDLAEVKHIGLFSQLRLRREAQAAGFDDAIFLERDGTVSEGGTWNLGFVREDGSVVWPSAPVLPGVTMQLLQEAHGSMKTEPVALDDVPAMAAAFATNTSIGVRPIRRINDVEFGTGHPALAELQAAYLDVPGEHL